MLVSVVERQDIAHLRVSEAVVALYVQAVIPLAGAAADHVDGGIRAKIQRKVVFRLRNDGAHAGGDDVRFLFFGLCLDGFVEGGPVVLPDQVVFIQPVLVYDPETGPLKALLHCDKVAGVDFSGACAALYGVADAAAVGHDRTRLFEGEGAIFFQEDHAFAQMASKALYILYFVAFGFSHIFLLERESDIDFLAVYDNYKRRKHKTKVSVISLKQHLS